MNRKWFKWVWIGAGVSVGFISYRILRQAPDSANVETLYLFLAVLAAVISQLLSAFVWTLFVSNGQKRSPDFFDYIVVQPGKYIPSGVLQHLGLYARYKRRDQTRSIETFAYATASTAYHAVVRPAPLISAFVIVLMALMRDHVGLTLGAVTSVSVAAILLGENLLLRAASNRRRLDVGLEGEGRLKRTLMKTAGALRPPIMNSWYWALIPPMCAAVNGMGFALLAGRASYMAIYVLAVAIGLLAIPIPAGLGVREAAFVFLAGNGFDSETVQLLLLYRFIHIVTELVLSSVTLLPIGAQHLKVPRKRNSES